MAISIYDTATLIAVVENLKEPSSFLLDKFFPQMSQSTSEFVTIDIFDGKRRLAPFVNPLREGKFVEPIGFRSPTFKPPYVKPKTRLDPARAVRRARGERIGGGDMSPQERQAVNLRFELEDQIGQINRRLEWMAGSALASGTLTVIGEGVPTATIDYGRDPSLQVALTGGLRWGQAGISPAADIDTWAAQVLKTSGFAPTDVVFTPSAWKAFRADPMVASIVGSFANGERDFAAAGVKPGRGGVRLGVWGQYTLWLYFEWFIDPVDGIEKPMLPDGTVLLGSDEVDGTRAFAAILDEGIGYPAIPYAPKSWVTDDPGARWLMTQSSPIVIPTRVNASFSAKVN